MEYISVRKAQESLRDSYGSNPKLASVLDQAVTWSNDNSDPYHALVNPMPGTGVVIPVGVHKAIGGHHDAATPGDLLCAALASCLDSSLRMVANVLGVELIYLSVLTKAAVDVRGTMLISRDVPVGFTHMHCYVTLRVSPNVSTENLRKMCKMAEYCCVVKQTLACGPSLNVVYDLQLSSEAA